MTYLDTVDLRDNETLVSILYGNASEEFISQVTDLNNQLTGAGFTAQLDALSKIESDYASDILDQLELSTMVDEVMREAARVALVECGVNFDDEIPLQALIELVTFTLFFEVPEEHDILYGLLESADDAHDAFCKALEFITKREYLEWFEYIREPGDGLIDRIRELIHIQSNGESLAAIDYAKASVEFAERLNKTRELFMNNTNALEAIDGLNSEPSTESMYLINLPDLIDASVEVAVENVVMIGTVTSPSFETAKVKVALMLDDLYEDPSLRMKANVVANEIYGKIQNVYG